MRWHWGYRLAEAQPLIDRTQQLTASRWPAPIQSNRHARGDFRPIDERRPCPDCHPKHRVDLRADTDARPKREKIPHSDRIAIRNPFLRAFRRSRHPNQPLRPFVLASHLWRPTLDRLSESARDGFIGREVDVIHRRPPFTQFVGLGGLLLGALLHTLRARQWN